MRRTNEEVVKDFLSRGQWMLETGRGLVDYAQTICTHSLTKVVEVFVADSWPEGGYTKYKHHCTVCGKLIKES